MTSHNKVRDRAHAFYSKFSPLCNVLSPIFQIIGHFDFFLGTVLFVM
jgi:hypothetical protein